VVLPPSVGATAQIKTYWDLFEQNLAALVSALGEKPAN
jgi:hypothetical protein